MSVVIAENHVATRNSLRSNDLVAARRVKTRATLVWVCVMLLAAEGGVRLRAWHRHGTGRPIADIYEPDEHVGRRPRPGAELHGRLRSLTINRWGFRGSDISKKKPPGRIRIAAVGDSATFGMEASSDQAVWGARMVALLNDATDAPRYDFLNGAVPGYTLEASITQLIEHIAPFDPDVVIVYQVGTDISAHARRQFAADSDSKTSGAVTKFMQETSLLFNLIRVNAAALSSKLMPQRRHHRLDERGVEEYAKRLAQVVRIGKQHNWRVVLCTCPRAFGDPTAPTDECALAASALANNPSLSLAGLNDAFERYNDVVRRVAQETDVMLVDLDRIVPKRRDYFADAMHLNDLGHQLVGEAIAAAVMDEEGGGAVALTHP